MRRLVVIVMVMLLVIQAIADVSIFDAINGNYASFLGVQKFSYIHHLFLVEYIYEIVFFKVVAGILIMLFWLRQLIYPVKALLLRRLTSYYLVYHMVFLCMTASIIFIVLGSVGEGNSSLFDIMSTILYVATYEGFLWFGKTVATIFLFLLLPIWHFHLALRSHAKA